MKGTDDDICPPLNKRLPGSRQHTVDKFQAGYAVSLIKGFDKGGQ
jgi:hypothetical protein